MNAPVLYPYPTMTDAEPILTVTRLRMDGKPRPDWVRKEELLVALFEQPTQWQRAELELEVTVPAAVVGAFEKAHGAVAAVAVAHCLPTNSREQVRLVRRGTNAGRWEGTLDLDRDNYRGRVKLETTLTANASDRPRPVATAAPWTIHFDEPESFQWGKCLPVKWLNFETAAEGTVARAHPKSTHVVDFGGTLPVLYLNAAFSGLEALLKDRKARKGAEKALHDILRTGIARGVWMALLKAALADIHLPEDGDGTAAEWPETPWRTEVLRQILPDVAPGKTDAELVGLALASRSDVAAAGELFARAEAVVGDVVTANEAVRRFVHRNTEEVIG